MANPDSLSPIPMTDQTHQGALGEAGRDTENPLTYLHHLIVEGFDLEELRTLCFDLGVRYDDLRGDTLSGKTRELILLLGRRHQLEDLLRQIARTRPYLSDQAVLGTDPAAVATLYAALPSLGDAPDWTMPVLVLTAERRELLDLPSPPGQPHLDLLQPEISRLRFEPETVLVPAGVFLMGSLEDGAVPADETPQHQVELRACRIGKYPVINEQYTEFVKQARHPAPRKAGWFGQRPPQEQLDHPVVGVTWYDALAYCRWLSDKTGRVYRLPTEAEWEKAARGADGRLYPWGEAWDPEHCNCTSAQTTPVTAHPAGASPYGCYDLVGNVWEWTSTLWGGDWKSADYAYPYRADDGRENLEAGADVHRLFRGGSFADEVAQLRCAARRWYAPDHADSTRGFRVALEIQP
jgi:formylglycine-generating enzyme required for sulfatase activity